ncbi:MAG: GntR family transcriptional regulator [Treponema sp.]|nr:GntR family transcriptional regulator [Treponema sp.]
METNTRDTVYSSLRDSIINLNLAPGTGISETELSGRFKLSRTPIREALIRLSKEGLVRVVPQKETLVSLIDLIRVEQEFFLRESLEEAVLGPFIKHCESRHFAEMEGLIVRQKDAIKSKSYVDFIKLDDNFHRILFDAGGQHLSWEVLSKMIGHYHRLRMLTIRIASIGEEKVNEHSDLLKALQKKDLRLAKKLLYNHLHNLETEVKLVQKEFPGYLLDTP